MAVFLYLSCYNTFSNHEKNLLERYFRGHVCWYRHRAFAGAHLYVFYPEHPSISHMTRRQTFWAAYAVGFAVSALIAVFAFYQLNQVVPQHVNWKALNLTSLQGEPVSIDKYKGKVVVLNVWATWCKPCIEEMPSMDRLQQLYPDKIAVVTVSDEEADKLQKFRSRQPYSFTYLKANSPLAEQQLTVYPTTYILNPNGDIKEIYLGAQAWDSESMQKRLLKML